MQSDVDGDDKDDGDGDGDSDDVILAARTWASGQDFSS